MKELFFNPIKRVKKAVLLKCKNIEMKDIKNKAIRELVVARLEVLPPNIIFATIPGGSWTRDEMIEHVRKGDKVGEGFVRVEMEWLRSLKDSSLYDLLGMRETRGKTRKRSR